MSYSPDNRGENALTACLAAATEELEKWQGKLAAALASDTVVDATGDPLKDIREAEDTIVELEREIEYLEERLG